MLTHRNRKVSIPFKRESTFKLWGISECLLSNFTNFQFQFPSNGKAHLNFVLFCYVGDFIFLFQFPSNGKAHLNNPELAPDIEISRGFQFPSNGKAHLNNYLLDDGGAGCRFQFPSNGKAHLNFCWREFCPTQMCFPVSIPFKRESTFKQCGLAAAPKGTQGVSIPFKRESTFKRNSGSPHHRHWIAVSIPFKRESTFKRVKFVTTVWWQWRKGFNSLQTGKHI